MSKNSNNILNQVLVVMVSFSLIVFPCVGYADETIVTLKAGDPAPFGGTLFNVEASANILVRLENFDTACQVEIDREVERAQSVIQYGLDLEKASKEACLSELDLSIQLQKNHVEFLTNQAALTKSNRSKPEVWLGAGVLGGIVLSLGTAWAWSQVSNAN